MSTLLKRQSRLSDCATKRWAQRQFFNSHGFARAMRDVHAVGAHAILSRRFMELSGKALLGLFVDNPPF